MHRVLQKDHPSIGKPCAACQKPLLINDYIALVGLGPGDDPEEQKKCEAGHAYNAVAAICHAACADEGGK